MSKRPIHRVITVLVVLGLGGCAALPAPSGSASPSNQTGSADGTCDSNRDYAMTGVVHATTQRERDDCRRAAGWQAHP